MRNMKRKRDTKRKQERDRDRECMYVYVCVCVCLRKSEWGFIAQTWRKEGKWNIWKERATQKENFPHANYTNLSFVTYFLAYLMHKIKFFAHILWKSFFLLIKVYRSCWITHKKIVMTKSIATNVLLNVNL